MSRRFAPQCGVVDHVASNPPFQLQDCELKPECWWKSTWRQLEPQANEEDVQSLYM
jgi:hypothetical protein